VKNNLNLTPIIFVMFLLIITIYYYRLELASLLYLGISILINNLESINSYLKDYLEIDNPIKEISEDNKLLPNTNLNNIESNNIIKPDGEPFYKTKTFWIISGIALIVVVAHIYTLSSGGIIINNNIELNTQNQLLNNIKNTNLNDLLELKYYLAELSSRNDYLSESIEEINDLVHKMNIKP
jgi:hypothetical protein